MSIPCPRCYSMDVSVSDTRPVAEPVHTIRRRRKCGNCKQVWTTFEVAENFMRNMRNAMRALKAVQKIRVDDLEELDPTRIIE